MTKTAKSNLLPLLEGAVPPVEQPPSDAVNIVDGMAVLQAFKAGPPLEAILVIFGRRALIFFV